MSLSLSLVKQVSDATARTRCPPSVCCPFSAIQQKGVPRYRVCTNNQKKKKSQAIKQTDTQHADVYSWKRVGPPLRGVACCAAPHGVVRKPKHLRCRRVVGRHCRLRVRRRRSFLYSRAGDGHPRLSDGLCGPDVSAEHALGVLELLLVGLRNLHGVGRGAEPCGHRRPWRSARCAIDGHRLECDGDQGGLLW